MKEKYTAPEFTVIVMNTEEVATLSTQSGREGTNVLANWLIGG
jgi:hypothetical protein